MRHDAHHEPSHVRLICRALMLAGICLVLTGCETMIESIVDHEVYKSDVKYYKGNGYDDETARRKADVDELFRKIDRESEKN